MTNKQKETKVLEILRSFIVNGFKISDTELIKAKELKSKLDFDGNYLISRIKNEVGIKHKSKGDLSFFVFFN